MVDNQLSTDQVVVNLRFVSKMFPEKTLYLTYIEDSKDSIKFRIWLMLRSIDVTFATDEYGAHTSILLEDTGIK